MKTQCTPQQIRSVRAAFSLTRPLSKATLCGINRKQEWKSTAQLNRYHGLIIGARRRVREPDAQANAQWFGVSELGNTSFGGIRQSVGGFVDVAPLVSGRVTELVAVG